ncbi:hypothetical protein Daura_23565 [Dactylosporangium aurantiacum]|uniref:Uncharacterized protein n=1 Tax=Dactylosporangium aurantiacum TaxID=35754 RepID=A0A9Q9INF3_9ACTN|nr:hypothetical protein [Dactylosporangium aurantiacum]MDG6103932.1 hypothetical protein [Dactylosporangium aurantiacum]UWZ58881.1 hypothetical protein Daura_23565 [Dactylosporangium aurantiacum]
MDTDARPTVERVHPPKTPFRLFNWVMRRVLTAPRSAGRAGRHRSLEVTGGPR